MGVTVSELLFFLFLRIYYFPIVFLVSWIWINITFLCFKNFHNIKIHVHFTCLYFCCNLFPSLQTPSWICCCILHNESQYFVYTLFLGLQFSLWMCWTFCYFLVHVVDKTDYHPSLKQTASIYNLNGRIDNQPNLCGPNDGCRWVKDGIKNLVQLAQIK